MLCHAGCRLKEYHGSGWASGLASVGLQPPWALSLTPSPAPGQGTLRAEWRRATRHGQLVFAGAAGVPASVLGKHHSGSTSALREEQSEEQGVIRSELKVCFQRAESEWKLPASLPGSSHSRIKGGRVCQMESRSARFTAWVSLLWAGSVPRGPFIPPNIAGETESEQARKAEVGI